MFKLTETQTRILKTCFDIQVTDHDSEPSITSYTLRKKGISGRTFNINKDELLFHHLIHVREKSKTGKQTRLYYEITPFGFFCLLKSLIDNDNPNYLDYVKYIPFIGDKWKTYEKILKPYDNLLNRILSRALNELNVLPLYKFHTSDKKFKFRVEESTELNFEDYGAKITTTDFYPNPRKNSGIKPEIFLTKTVKAWENYFNKDFIKLSENTLHQLIFLFYFNGFKLKYDDRFGLHLFNNQYWFDIYKETKFIPKKQDKSKSDDVSEKEFDTEFKKIWGDYDKFWQTKRVDFLNQIATDVFDDNELSLIFIECYTKTTNIFRVQPRTIQNLDLIIKNKMITLGIRHGLIEEKTIRIPNGEEIRILNMKDEVLKND